VALAAASLAACSGGQSIGGGSGTASNSSPYGFTTAKQDASAPITVWVDSTRLAAAQAFEKANPSIKIKIVTYDGDANGSNSFRTKMELFNRAGSGWPDVVFTADDNSASWGSMSGTGNLAPLNKGTKQLVPGSTLAGFATGSLGVCTVNGSVYCLPSSPGARRRSSTTAARCRPGSATTTPGGAGPGCRPRWPRWSAPSTRPRPC
jgi:ABC-type glycerol-3-phosphate transport system substrate-binding protein